MREIVYWFKVYIRKFFEEAYKQLESSMHLCDPIHLEREVQKMYGRGEIEADQYRRLIEKVRVRHIGRGDLDILHREVELKRIREGSFLRSYPLTTMDQGLDRLAISRVQLEDARIETQQELDMLRSEVKRIHERTEWVREKAKSALPDESEARHYLQLKQELQEAVGVLEAHIHTMAHRLRQIEALQHRLIRYEVELKVLESEERLASLETRVHENLLNG